MKILVYIQNDDNSIGRNSIEALAGAQKLAKDVGGDISVVCFNDALSPELMKYNVSELISINNEALNNYSPLYFTSAMEQIANDVSADIIIFGHTYQVRDWVPRLSARLDAPFVSDCINLDSSSELVAIRQTYQGKINTNISTDGLAIISFQSGAFRADQVEAGEANKQNFDVDLSSVPTTVRPGEKFKESKGGVDLTRAKIIVSVGRGIGKEENISFKTIIHSYFF